MTSTHTTDPITVTITPPKDGAPANKLAEAELVFHDGVMAGTKLTGFTIWSGKDGHAHVTFPARSYSKEGATRYYNFLKETGDNSSEALRAFILAAYTAHNEAAG